METTGLVNPISMSYGNIAVMQCNKKTPVANWEATGDHNSFYHYPKLVNQLDILNQSFKDCTVVACSLIEDSSFERSIHKTVHIACDRDREIS